jgi:hypothetical protein
MAFAALEAFLERELFRHVFHSRSRVFPGDCCETNVR